MNIIYKIYSRVYQQIMHALIPIMPYREPKLLNSADEIPEILKTKKIENVILLTDKGVHGLGLTYDIEKALSSHNINCFLYNDVNPNPTIDNVEASLKIYKENSCKAIIAVGGGSVMDCAKALGARVARPKKTLIQMKGLLKVLKPIPLLICTPTTAGTGSETTLAAVITDSTTHLKYAINDFALIPSYALLEPKLTVGLPKGLTATTGMDALTHAIEAYIGNSTVSKTRTYSYDAIKIIFENILTAYNEGTNLEARKNMLHASYIAGLAFTQSYVGYVHAIAHSLGGEYGVAHGLANAVILPIVLEAYGTTIDSKLAKIARKIGMSFNNTDDHTIAKEFINHIKTLNAKMQIPTYIEQLKEEDIPKLAKKAIKEANPLYPVPVIWSQQEMEAVYKKLLKK